MSSYVQDFCLGDVYPSPEGDCDAESPQPLEGSSTSPSATPDAKAPAKRKRENRYKNAPPSVLSVRTDALFTGLFFFFFSFFTL